MVFGLPPTAAKLSVAGRPKSVRTLRTAMALLGTALVAPLAFLIPPHAPWGVGALLGGILTARRQWLHTRTVLSLDATCPACEHALELPSGGRLRSPHSLSCQHCHQAVLIRFDASEQAES